MVSGTVGDLGAHVNFQTDLSTTELVLIPGKDTVITQFLCVEERHVLDQTLILAIVEVT